MEELLVIGSACVDVSLRVSHLPQVAEDVAVTSQRMTIGGCAFNVANMVRQMGEEVTFICPVGGGIYGEWVKQALTKRGFCDYIAVDGENGCCYCLVDDDGERTFLAYHGVEYTFCRNWLKPWAAKNFRRMYVCGLELAEPTGDELIDHLASLRQTEIWLALGSCVEALAGEKLTRLLDLHPIIHVNEGEAMALANELCGEMSERSVQQAAAIIQARTQQTVIVTLGAQGVYCLEASGEHYHLAAEPTTVADTIGAGDGHMGAILAGLAKGYSLQQALMLAGRAASLIVGTHGAEASDESVAELLKKSEKSLRLSLK